MTCKAWDQLQGRSDHLQRSGTNDMVYSGCLRGNGRLGD